MTSSYEAQLQMLEDSVDRTVTSVDAGFGAVMRQHLNLHRGQNEVLYAPAIVCLSLCEGYSGSSEASLGFATAVALLIEAGRLFIELEEVPAKALIAEWGMPRALNAGDGFYALAKDRLARAAASLPPAPGTAAVAALDIAARAFSEAIAGGAASPAIVRLERAIGALYPAAARLAGVFAGADTKTMAMFEQAGAEMAADIAKMADADFTGPRVRLDLNRPSTRILDLRNQQ